MVTDTLPSIDKAISRFMSDNKMTCEQMAKLLSISTNTLRWKRKGIKKWTWDEILILSEHLGKSPDELAGFKF